MWNGLIVADTAAEVGAAKEDDVGAGEMVVVLGLVGLIVVFIASKLLSRARRRAAEQQPSRVPRRGVRDRAVQAADGKSQDNG